MQEWVPKLSPGWVKTENLFIKRFNVVLKTIEQKKEGWGQEGQKLSWGVRSRRGWVLGRSSHILFRLNWYQRPRNSRGPIKRRRHLSGPLLSGCNNEDSICQKAWMCRYSADTNIYCAIQKAWAKDTLNGQTWLSKSTFYTLENFYTVIIPASMRHEAESFSFSLQQCLWYRGSHPEEVCKQKQAKTGGLHGCPYYF